MNPQRAQKKILYPPQAPQGMSSLRRQVGKHGIYALRGAVFLPFPLDRKKHTK